VRELFSTLFYLCAARTIAARQRLSHASIMCFLCNEEVALALGKRKRAADAASSSALTALPPSPLILVPCDGLPIEAPRNPVLALCKSLPPEDVDGRTHLQEERHRNLALVVEFCQRFCNVNGRPASVALAWRKAIRPQLRGEGHGDEADFRGMWALVGIARRLGCAPLSDVCCATLAAEELCGSDATAVQRKPGPIAAYRYDDEERPLPGADRAVGPLDPFAEARRDVQTVLESWLGRAAEEGDEEAAAEVLRALAAPRGTAAAAAHASEARTSQGAARERGAAEAAEAAEGAGGAEADEEASSAQCGLGSSPTSLVNAVDAIWRGAAADALASRRASVALGLDVTGAGDLAWLLD
jgi:hypothetical protein